MAGLTEQTAEREIARRVEIDKRLDYISRQLDQLKVIKQLPESIIRPDELVNRAMDVQSASLNYVTVHIQHESQYLGVAGTPFWNHSDKRRKGCNNPFQGR